jgi:hypothetical protein
MNRTEAIITIETDGGEIDLYELNTFLYYFRAGYNKALMNESSNNKY